MASEQPHGRMRMGIAGLDHWYIGLDAARAAQAHPDIDLVVVAHRDEARAHETARQFGAVEVTTDYTSVVRRDDLDIVVTACRSSENAALCVEAAGRGMHILSVKPIAMTREDAARVQDAVERAGVRFMSWESTYRLRQNYRQIKSWIDEGLIGRPISGLFVMRSTLPTQVWPGVQGRTWWLDPRHAPGGGWLDHSIYAVDALRWLFDAEVAATGGIAATLVHKELPAELEDFGLATLTFDGGQAASVEVTWTAARGAFTSVTHIVGDEGAILLDWQAPGQARITGHTEPFRGWTTVTLPEKEDDPVSHLVAALRTGESLPSGAGDAARNLDVCLTFYEAAREGTIKPIGDQQTAKGI